MNAWCDRRVIKVYRFLTNIFSAWQGSLTHPNPNLFLFFFNLLKKCCYCFEYFRLYYTYNRFFRRVALSFSFIKIIALGDVCSSSSQQTSRKRKGWGAHSISSMNGSIERGKSPFFVRLLRRWGPLNPNHAHDFWVNWEKRQDSEMNTTHCLPKITRTFSDDLWVKKGTKSYVW